jgi:hypothetical protein
MQRMYAVVLDYNVVATHMVIEPRNINLDHFDVTTVSV